MPTVFSAWWLHLAEYRTTSLMAFSHSPVHCGNSSEHHTDQPKSDHTVMGNWHGKTNGINPNC